MCKQIAVIVASPYISGAEYVAMEIISCLNSEFKDIRVFARDNFIDQSSKLPKKNFIKLSPKLPSCKISANPIGLIFYIFYGLYVIRKLNKFKVFYCNDIEACFTVMLAALVLRKKVIFHVHDVYKQNKKVFFLFSILNFIVDQFVCLTEKNKERLSALTQRKINVVNNGLSESLEKNLTIDKIIYHSQIGKKEEDIITLGFIGQIVPWKNTSKILDFTLYLREKGLNVQLKVAGSYNYSTNLDYGITFLERIKKLPNVAEYLGIIARENISDFYLTLDFLVNFSDNEPYGLVLIEALYHGIPIIAIDGDGPHEIIKNNDHGIIISSFDEGYKYIKNQQKEKGSGKINKHLYAKNRFSSFKFNHKILQIVKESLY